MRRQFGQGIEAIAVRIDCVVADRLRQGGEFRLVQFPIVVPVGEPERICNIRRGSGPCR